MDGWLDGCTFRWRDKLVDRLKEGRVAEDNYNRR
jgi:hypothetical protein